MPKDLLAPIPTGTPGVELSFLHGKTNITRVVVPAGIAFSVPSHYHLKYDEYFSVESGQPEVTCDGVSTVVSTADGELKIPCGWAGVGPFLIAPSPQEPRDNRKEWFLRNMFYGAETGGIKPLQIYVAMYQADNFPDLPGKIHWLGEP